MSQLFYVRDHRLRAIGISALGAALLVLPGCIACYQSAPVTVTVLDAESEAPIPGAQVDLRYSSMMYLNAPREVSGETGSDGRVEIEETTFGGEWWRVSAPGYITTDDSSPRPEGSLGNPREFRLYREPNPEIVVVIPNGYVGPVFVDLIHSNSWIQETAGSRRFRFDSSANGYVPIIASPLIRRAWDYRAEYRDGTPIARKKDASDHQVAFRWVGVGMFQSDRDMYVVGTSADEQAFLEIVTPRTDSLGTRNWDHAAAARVFSDAKQASERADVMPAAR